MSTQFHAPSAPVVSTAHGPVAGRWSDGVSVFRDIPFAASTAGENRFAPPAPPEPWTEPRDGTAVAAAAPQNPSILERAAGLPSLTYDEDCLRVNVFTPDGAGGAPVMVWLHGGGFETGAASMSWYDGHRLARRGVVVVSVGYRLGALGYLHLPGVPGSGCFGLLDQVAALRWVRDNVAAFGGDPGRVTVFGESAGAMSIGTLLGSPVARGLFHRAILQSGAAQNVHRPEMAAAYAARFCAAAGVAPGDLAALRALPLDAVLRAQDAVGREGAGGLPWQPVLGSEAVPVWPLDAVRAGSAERVPVLVGTTLDEARILPMTAPSLAVSDQAALERRAGAYAGLMGRSLDSLLTAYGARAEAGSAPDQWLVLLTDLVFRVPAIRLAEAQVDRGAPVHMYLFAEQSSSFGGALGACHAIDLPFTWDNLDQSGVEVLAGPVTAERQVLARRMADLWAAFARGDDAPTAEGVPSWPAYDRDRRATLWLAADRVEVVDDPFAGERAWWDGLDAGLDFDLTVVG